MSKENRETDLPLSVGLDGLWPLSVDDLVSYQSAVEVGRQTGWRYNFPNLLTRNLAWPPQDVLHDRERLVLHLSVAVPGWKGATRCLLGPIAHGSRCPASMH